MDLVRIKSVCRPGCILSGSSGENQFSYLFQLLEVPTIPLLVAPSAIFKSSSERSHLLTQLQFTSFAPSLTYGTLMGPPG